MFGVVLRVVCMAAVGWTLPFLLGTALASGQQAGESTIDMQWAVKIPARDGVKLNATVFTPHGQNEPLPVVFTFTPYIGDSYTDRAMYFAKHGYVYALVDVRGHGQWQAIWGQWVLGGEVTRDVHDALGVSGLRQAGWEPFDGVSEMADASESRRLLRRDGAECGAVQENEFADPDDYWTLRRRSAGGVHVLQAAHAVRNGGSKG